MRKKILFFLLLGLPFFTFSQNTEEDLVIATVKQLFDGMRAGDSTMVRSAFSPDVRMQTAFTDKNGDPQIKTGSLDGFVKAVGTPHDKVWDEKIWSYQVHIDDRLATVWTDYTFYLGNRLSHCGVNAFHLFKGKEGWKIIQITDTRRKSDCQTDPKAAINELMDQWHLAAAKADEDVFFGSMGDDAIYIGTDASERWEKAVFEEWSKEYFQKETAWDFKPIEREIYFSGTGEVAWFNETLDTWMGVCRGSGILEKNNGKWKLQHYHLAIAVPNEKVKAYLELLNKE